MLSLAAAALFAPLAHAADKPHILMLLADDFGWANAGWHRKAGYQEVQTPNMDMLVKQGIELDRAYSFKFCSPTRSALQSGRLPTHVNVLNLDMDMFNPKDPVSGFAGIPRNMTGMAEHMKAGGYVTHQTGKWDAGMATPEHTPQGRGYDSSLGYFHHANDYWTEHVGDYVDMWFTDAPAHGQNGSDPCQRNGGGQCTTGPEKDYEEYKFAQYVLKTIQAHDPSKPLFYNYDFHIVHEPLQVPTEYHKRFAFIENSTAGDFEGHRQTYHAMVNYMDMVIGELVALLKQKGMWDNTVIFFQSDNGGPSFAGSSHTANNYPLKGTKMANWEGGVRVNAFVSGGLIAAKYPNMVGKKLEGYVSIADYYATCAGIAGVDPTDKKAAAAGLPPIDSLNMWPYFTGQTDKSPRTEIFNDVSTAIVGDFKIMTGSQANACWAGPQYPNSSDPTCRTTINCGDGCLFNIKEDPTEHNNIAAQNPEKLKELQQRLAEMNNGFFDPDRQGGDTNVAKDAAEKYGGFWGPFLP